MKKKLLKGIWQKWLWLLFPVFVSLSVLWSMNSLRGLLTVGILWLVYFAGYAFWSLRSLFSEFGFLEKFWRVFFASALVACGWCLLQCILDIAGVPRGVSLMCAGCTYQMFGFPHPNGWAIEPQFMGNLLLAPAITSAWMVMQDICNGTFRGRVAHARRRGVCALILGRNLRKPLKIPLPNIFNCHLLLVVFMFFVFVATIFLTFSRGAIYAFAVSMIFMTAVMVVRTKKWRVMLVWPVILVAFLFTLNLQGMMAEFGPTSDNYSTGVAKVLNHLSLGIIDIRGGDEKKVSEETDALVSEITEENVDNDEKSEAVFDGYVEESTDTRLRLSGAAAEVWKQDFTTMMFGVGIGGAGQALYVNKLSPAPKEIVQNEYASLLLETGFIGVALLILTVGLIVRAVYQNEMVTTLIVAYAITLLFFSGLPNALHIYLLPALFIALCGKSLYHK